MKVGILLAELLHVVSDAVGQLLAGRAQIAAAGRRGIVAIVAGRRGASVEVLGLGEVLPDQLRAHNAPVRLDQAAIRLVGNRPWPGP